MATKKTNPTRSAQKANSKVVTRGRTSKKAADATSPDLPTVSKQTAGGIAGATIGGMVGGPIGAVVGGVAGAMVGNASAEGQHPIETAVEGIRSVAEKPIRQTVKRVAKVVAKKATQAKSLVMKNVKATKKAVAAKLSSTKKSKTSGTGSTKAAATRN